MYIITKCTTIEEALFYVNHTIEYGWSRVVLEHQIDMHLFEREGKAITNFSKTLPALPTIEEIEAQLRDCEGD